MKINNVNEITFTPGETVGGALYVCSSMSHGIAKTPVSLLQELYVKRGIKPTYELIQIKSSQLKPITFKCRVSVGETVGEGTGLSKQKAKHAAAKAVLEETLGKKCALLLENRLPVSHLRMIRPVPKAINKSACILCQKPGKYECSTCHMRYCSDTCQNKDWPTHIYICTKPPLIPIIGDEPPISSAPIRKDPNAKQTSLMRTTFFPERPSGTSSVSASIVGMKPSSAFVPYDRRHDHRPSQEAVAITQPRYPPVSGMKTFQPFSGLERFRPVPSWEMTFVPQQQKPKPPIMTAPKVVVDPNASMVITPSGLLPVMPPKSAPTSSSFSAQFYDRPAHSFRPKNPFTFSRFGPVKDSIVDYLKPGDNVTFLTTTPFRNGRAAGIISRSEDDLGVLSFNNFAKKLAPPSSDFKPDEGSIVAVLSPTYREWFRGYITRTSSSSGTYSVLYIDYGNTEDGVQAVMPIPPGYRHPSLAVKLTLRAVNGGELAEDVEDSAARRFSAESRHELRILKEERDGSVGAVLYDEEGFSVCGVKLEPWKSLIRSKPPRPPPPARRQIPSRSLGIDFADHVMIFRADGVDDIIVQHVSEDVVASSESIQGALASYWPDGIRLTSLPAVGSYVAAEYPGGSGFYRSRVLSVNYGAKEPELELDYVDYGLTARVPLSSLRALPDKLYQQPACVHRVSLADVGPIPSGPLPEIIRSLLDESIGEVFFMLALPSGNESTTKVKLTGEDGRHLNELIRAALETLRTPSVSPPLPAMPKLELAPPDTPLPVDNTLGIYRYDAGPFAQLPETDVPFQALILAVHDPQCIILSSLEDRPTIAKLQQLEDLLEDYGGGIARAHYPKVGEICLALCIRDDKWHRAACLEVTGSGHYLLMLVDSGQTILADSQEIRRIPKRLVEFLPYVAQEVALRGCEDLNPVPESLVDRLRELLLEGTHVNARVIRRRNDCIPAYVVDIPEVYVRLIHEGLLITDENA